MRSVLRGPIYRLRDVFDFEPCSNCERAAVEARPGACSGAEHTDAGPPR
jgi:hypothetical protein